jgi:hypothetical protein
MEKGDTGASVLVRRREGRREGRREKGREDVVNKWVRMEYIVRYGVCVCARVDDFNVSR